MRKVETLFGLVLLLVITGLISIITINAYQTWRAKQQPQPSGIWAGIVDDLPSGRLVECVFARDPSGSVAVTCDWQRVALMNREEGED